MREISTQVLLYTEMIVAQSLVFSERKKQFLDFNSKEHPIAIQFGGDDPQLLKEVAKMAKDWNYDEINFNVGCPSPRVSSGNFGASLMHSPKKVAECIEALNNNSDLPVTIKHRIGVDDNDSFCSLNKFVKDIALAGADRFTIHARKAILKGLNPKANRTIPPLRYDIVEKLKNHNPNLIIEINGGFVSIEQAFRALKIFDAVMVGRSAYKHPLKWSEIDEKFYGKEKKEKKASKIILNLIPYIEKNIASTGSTWEICKHLINLVEEIPMAKIWRKNISLKSINNELKIEDLKESAMKLQKMGY